MHELQLQLGKIARCPHSVPGGLVETILYFNRLFNRKYCNTYPVEHVDDLIGNDAEGRAEAPMRGLTRSHDSGAAKAIYHISTTRYVHLNVLGQECNHSVARRCQLTVVVCT
eukprot:223472-Pyramimonas_sp.AAC.1